MTDPSKTSAFQLELPADQQRVLDGLKKFVREDLRVTDPKYDDFYLARFCRAKAFDLEQAKAMFSKCLEWRKQHDVDNIHTLDVKRVRQVDHLFPHNYYCVDHEGQCVYIERYKNFDLKEIKRVGQPQLDPRHEVSGRLLHLQLRAPGAHHQPLLVEASRPLHRADADHHGPGRHELFEHHGEEGRDQRDREDHLGDRRKLLPRHRPQGHHRQRPLPLQHALEGRQVLSQRENRESRGGLRLRLQKRPPEGHPGGSNTHFPWRKERETLRRRNVRRSLQVTEYGTFFVEEYEQRALKSSSLQDLEAPMMHGSQAVSCRSVPVEKHGPINSVRLSFRPITFSLFPVEEKLFSNHTGQHPKGSTRTLPVLETSLIHEESFLEFIEHDKPRTPHTSYKSIFP